MTTIIKAKDGTDLDLGVVTLAKAIRQVESSNNYNSKGASGESGAYQYMPSSWKEWAGKYLGDSNAPMTPVNQDKVAYYRIKELKDAGNSPSQVASIWNSGSPEWEGKIGVNSKGVKYNVPAYVEKVKNEYINYKQLALATLPSNQTEATNTSTTPEKTGLFQSVVQSVSSLPLKLAATAVRDVKIIGGLIGAGIDTLLGNKDLAKSQLEEAKKPVEVDAGYFGKQYSLGTNTDGTLASPIETVKQGVGMGLETTAWLLPYGKVASVADGAITNFLTKNASKALSTGAIDILSNVAGKATAGMTGEYLSETGSRLQSNESVLSSANPFRVGTLLGAAFPVAFDAAAGATVKGGTIVWNGLNDMLNDILPTKLAGKFLNQSYKVDGNDVFLTIDDVVNSKLGFTVSSAIKNTEKLIDRLNTQTNILFDGVTSKSRISLKDVVLTAQKETNQFFYDAGIKTKQDIIDAIVKVAPKAKGILEQTAPMSLSKANRLRSILLEATMNTNDSVEHTIARAVNSSLDTSLRQFQDGIVLGLEQSGNVLSQKTKDLITRDLTKEISKNYAFLNVLKNSQSPNLSTIDVMGAMADIMFPGAFSHLGLAPLVFKGYKFLQSSTGKLVMIKTAGEAGKLTTKIGRGALKTAEKVDNLGTQITPPVIGDIQENK